MLLIMYITNNPNDPLREETLRLAESDRLILFNLSNRSITAHRCATLLMTISPDTLHHFLCISFKN